MRDFVILFVHLISNIIITSIERMPDAKGSHRKRAIPIGHEQILVVIDGRGIVEAYTKRRLLHDFVIRHRQGQSRDPAALAVGCRRTFPRMDFATGTGVPF